MVQILKFHFSENILSNPFLLYIKLQPDLGTYCIYVYIQRERNLIKNFVFMLSSKVH